jgi:tetratricopeptide (TPR) repeat protein
MTVEVRSYQPVPPMQTTTMTKGKVEVMEEEDLWTEASNEEEEEEEEEKVQEEDEIDVDGVPSETQLVLLCLDYLRDLRRAYPVDSDLEEAEGLHGKYLSLAIYALARCFVRPTFMQHDNDAWTPPTSNNGSVVKPMSTADAFEIPSLDVIQQEMFHENDAREYDDSHMSNSHRFFPLNGLASGPALLGGPLSLAAITSAGLTTLGARSRQEADREVTQSHLFEQFVAAVQSKGFFMDIENSHAKADAAEEKMRLLRQEQVYKERFAKVVSKFRTKLATKAAAAAQQQTRLIGATSPSSMSSNGRRNYNNHVSTTTNLQMASAAVDRQRQRREKRVTDVRMRRGEQQTVTGSNTTCTPKHSNQVMTPASMYSQPAPSLDTTLGVSVVANTPSTSKKAFFATPRAIPKTPDSTILSVMNQANFDSISVCTNADNPLDLEEAEKLKTRGNMHMQKKEYESAAAAYTQALKLSPAGPQSHVYFSNRAAALLSLKRFSEAVLDSERSLALKPDYGKAHARLGLAHYIMGNYKSARDAYATSLKYEPDNKSSRSYLEKSVRHLSHQEQQQKEKQQSQPSKSHNEDTTRVGDEVPRPPSDEEQENTVPVADSKPTVPISTSVADIDEDKKKQMILQEREAEKYKTRGNSCMANRDYQAAVEAYTIAIRLSPEGPQSHVYYSNRAAAFCYLERYNEAEWDSQQSLQLNPTYGKAHARLGLSRFFLADYKGAMEAYTTALQFDPSNAASKSYLLKAKARLERQQHDQRASNNNASMTPEERDEHGPFSSQTSTIPQSAEI